MKRRGLWSGFSCYKSRKSRPIMCPPIGDLFWELDNNSSEEFWFLQVFNNTLQWITDSPREFTSIKLILGINKIHPNIFYRLSTWCTIEIYVMDMWSGLSSQTALYVIPVFPMFKQVILSGRSCFKNSTHPWRHKFTSLRKGISNMSTCVNEKDKIIGSTNP